MQTILTFIEQYGNIIFSVLAIISTLGIIFYLTCLILIFKNYIKHKYENTK